VPAPIRKVAPNGFPFDALAGAAAQAEQSISQLDLRSIMDTLSAFGVVISSTAPQQLGRAAVARGNLRRLLSLK
jgi:hypothetical protein